MVFQKRIIGLTELALARFVNRARRAAKLRARVDVLVTSNAEMKSLNRSFRGKDQPTDVLSFPAPRSCTGFAGDIAISAEIAARNAQALGHSPAVEVEILVLHGLLHLCGYDHERDNGRMARREQQLRKQFRLPDALIERSGAARSPLRRRR